MFSVLKTRAVTSSEARSCASWSCSRVLSVAEVQSHLSSAQGIDLINIPAYRTKLFQSLAASMIGPEKPVDVCFASLSGSTIDSSRVVSLSLIVTELVLSATKHAIPQPRIGAAIPISHAATATEWTLAVRDNGVGTGVAHRLGSGGLGAAIVEVLAKKHRATIISISSLYGRAVVFGPGKTGAALPIAA